MVKPNTCKFVITKKKQRGLTNICKRNESPLDKRASVLINDFLIILAEIGSFLETTGLPCLTASNSDKPWQIVLSKELLMMPGIKE